MEKVLSIALGGAFGALLRVYGSDWIMRFFPSAMIPYGTMVINILGAFLIGLCAGLFTGRPDWPAWARFLLISGGLGAFTTFSTYMLEWLNLMLAGNYGHAFVYGLAQVVAGLLLCWLGIIVARALI